jgi:hypothetical protein
MIIECEFTNATDFVRERVVFLTGMKLMIDSNGKLFAVCWEDYKEEVSLPHLRRAMHDPEFRIHLDRGGLLITMARCIERWTLWFISVDWRRGQLFYAKVRVLQRAIRAWVVRKRLSMDMVFSKSATARKLLEDRLNQDVMDMIIVYCTKRSSHPPKHNSQIWVKPERDGQIFD